MKKCFKLTTLCLAAFFLFSITAFAKSFKLEDLEKEIASVDETAGYAYIIGEYVFTSNYHIELKDIVLASTSIILGENKTDSSDIAIYYLERTYDAKYKPNGWKTGKNTLGTKVIPNTLDISYINYIDIGKNNEKKINFNIKNSLGFTKEKLYGSYSLEPRTYKMAK